MLLAYVLLLFNAFLLHIVLKSRMYERFKLGLFFQKFFITLSYFFIFKRAIKCYVGLSQSTWTPR